MTAHAVMTNHLRELLNQATRRLTDAGVETPRLDSELLLAKALGIEREGLLMDTGCDLQPGELSAFEALIGRRLAREPVARILGAKEFWSLDFALNAATLVPRPDSETLVEAALEEFDRGNNHTPRILDLGTGSGCLLLALLSEFPAATGIGLDCAGAALVAARKNAENLGLEARAEFLRSDWFEALDEGDAGFDLIISNPPYIESDAIAGLSPEVAEFDPPAALDGGTDGLGAYRTILSDAARFLTRDGVILLEFGQGQKKAVAGLLESGGFAAGKIYDDLAGIPRVISAGFAS